jgi:hypothetical protein
MPRRQPPWRDPCGNPPWLPVLVGMLVLLYLVTLRW